MKLMNLIAIIICVFAMLINYKNINVIVLNGFFAVINSILYIRGQDMSKELFKCKKCGEKMIWCENGSSEYDEEWLECDKCGETRELTMEEIEYDLEMRFQ